MVASHRAGANIAMVSDNIHMMWMGRKIHHHDATTAAVGTDWGCWLKSRVTAGHHDTMPLCSSWGCRLTWRMVPKSTYNIYKLFYNIHMVWIDWCIHRHAVTTTHDDQDLRMQLKSWVAFEHRTISLTCDWGCRPTLHGSHIHIKHKQGVWQPWYDVDGQNNPSPCGYHHSCWYRLGQVDWNPESLLGIIHQSMPLCSGWGYRLTWNFLKAHVTYTLFYNIHMVWIDR